MNAGQVSLQKPSWLSFKHQVCEPLTTTLPGPLVGRFLFLLGFLALAMPMGSHYLRVLQVRVKMFMVRFMPVRHAFMAVGMVMEKLKLFVLAGMLPT